MDSQDNVEILRLNLGDLDVVDALQPLFDQAVKPDAAEKFLRQDGHHLLVAFVQSLPVGFVSGVELTHPDKGTEMFLYELAVGDNFRRRGIGRKLVEALAALAHERGCYDLWVLTETENTAAIRTYQSAGGTDVGTSLMFEWRFA